MPDVRCDMTDCVHNCMGIGDIPICDKTIIYIEDSQCTDYSTDEDDL